MYWEEKLDHIKQHFSTSDFRDPFTEWSEILKKIEMNFIIKKDGKHTFCNWYKNIKHQQKIKVITPIQLTNELKNLMSDGNFWLVMVYGESATDKHLVYDCSLEPLLVLLPHLFDFYIIGKKYEWLAYFCRQEIPGKLVIYRSGDRLTPFDK